MPLRAYEPLDKPCRLCGLGFEHFEASGAAPLQTCPKCGADVRLRLVASVHTPTITKPLSPSEAKGAGFTVLKRVGRGEYEKQ